MDHLLGIGVCLVAGALVYYVRFNFVESCRDYSPTATDLQRLLNEERQSQRNFAVRKEELRLQELGERNYAKSVRAMFDKRRVRAKHMPTKYRTLPRCRS